ncbi:MAG: acetylornithine deacetylase/succinyl-diaminopimelate desuccinylase family protein [Acidobacteria bacterium]|nr:acetylornithine deacetylase/succinyl-diaminopimelate desuccinylase family protein [Acidobacteriota bacterium]MCW5970551.1 acetylornithine deacetylase/succinyl-diaminopimelate desuccinylase family protein [Blastocatellales bacterium]
MLDAIEREVCRRVDELQEELVDFLRALVRIPTINPPGANYADCAALIGERLREFGYDVQYVEAEDLPESSPSHPRINVIGRMQGRYAHPCLHFNGHIDVVPPGAGWTVDPFDAIVENGRLYGRGVTDQKAGIAASIYAVEAIRRAGVALHGAVEQSATVDEESGGLAGVAYLAERKYFRREAIDHVIITEPLDYDRICIGHRGVYWFDVLMRGRIAHGSMPFLGASAITRMGRLIAAIDRQLKPRLNARRTQMPVEPDGARSATININAVSGGQAMDEPQTPCVADSCRAIFDRRFLIEETLEDVRSEIIEVIESLRQDDPGLTYELIDRLIVHPTMTAPEAKVVAVMSSAIEDVAGCTPPLIASPGTYDQKHFARIAGIEECIAYGPGTLDLAHQPDEYCNLDELRMACKAMALAALRLLDGKKDETAENAE